MTAEKAESILTAESKPVSQLVGYVRHASGAQREVEVIGIDGKMLLIWWPTAGLHEVNTRTGRIKGGKRYAQWIMDPDEVSRCVRALQGHAKHLRRQTERPGERGGNDG